MSDDPLASLDADDGRLRLGDRRDLRPCRPVCGGRVVSSLEGGYDLTALGESTAAHVRVLRERGWMNGANRSRR